MRLAWQLHNLVNKRLGKPVRSEAILTRWKPMTISQVRTDFRVLYQAIVARFGVAAADSFSWGAVPTGTRRTQPKP